MRKSRRCPAQAPAAAFFVPVTLAGHHPKRNGPSSGASEAVPGRNAQSTERTRLFPRDGLSLRSNHSGLFCSGEWPKKAAPASGKAGTWGRWSCVPLGNSERHGNQNAGHCHLFPVLPDPFCSCAICAILGLCKGNEMTPTPSPAGPLDCPQNRNPPVPRWRTSSRAVSRSDAPCA
jgi:hypothetical protein